MFNNVVVVGVGSIGIKHAHFLKNTCQKLILIDPIFDDIENQVKFAEFITSIKYSRIENLESKFTNGDLAVIANWGPDHYKTIIKLSSLGLKNFVLEKPCADSLLELDNLWNITLSHKLRIVVNQGWYYDKLGLKINQMARKFGIGDAKAIFISGGARCISTAGSHWISLANQIFSSDPQFIFSNAKNFSINPRAAFLSYYEGVFSFSYADNRRLSISLTNESSVEGKVEIYWRDAIGIFQSGKFTVYSRENFPYSDQITRYGPANKMIHREELNDQHRSFINLYNSFQLLNQDEFNADLKNHLNVSRAIIIALISSEIGIQLAFSNNPNQNFYDKKFQIS